MLNVVIVEDEQLIAKDLAKLLRQIAPEINVEAILPGVKKAKQWFEQTPEPDLLFLDIQLSDGVSFDILEQSTIECPVIFTTAYNEYAIEAFKVNSIDYLLKPIEKEELARALQKFKKLRESGIEFKTQLKELMQGFSNQEAAPQYKKRFLVHQRNLLVPI
ncbi:MAG: LytR/AlgR family response regulator transcription factor, partial [Thermonemataceae bacterium]